MLESQIIATPENLRPFWLRTNQAGSVPITGISASLIAAAKRDYKIYQRKAKSLDWGAGIETRVNFGRKSNLLLTEAYLKARLNIFELNVGRSRQIIGLTDSSLSSGSFSVSGNALPIPSIMISIQDYWNLPYTNGWIAVKGGIQHGWFGRTELLGANYTKSETHSYYHQKSFYVRIGRQTSKLQLSGGFNHQAMWGHEAEFMPGYNLNAYKSYLAVFTGKPINGSKVGNHIGSIDQAVSINGKRASLFLYHQFFYEVGGLYRLNNIRDGLWGLSLKRLVTKNWVGWKKINLEFLYSKSQGGELDARPTFSGDEDYYNNGSYSKGWSYKGENIGNNFFTNKSYLRNADIYKSKEYFGNNRVILLHGAIEWFFKDVKFIQRISYSRNFGSYASSPMGNSAGYTRFINLPPYFQPVNQFSGYLEVSKPLKKNLLIGLAFAIDQGQLLYNSAGGLVKLSKSW